MQGALVLSLLQFGKPPGGGVSHDGPVDAGAADEDATAALAPGSADALAKAGFAFDFSGGGSGSPTK
jgi:hypothetical protein